MEHRKRFQGFGLFSRFPGQDYIKICSNSLATPRIYDVATFYDVLNEKKIQRKRQIISAQYMRDPLSSSLLRNTARDDAAMSCSSCREWKLIKYGRRYNRTISDFNRKFL
jgi:hypothetical protein